MVGPRAPSGTLQSHFEGLTSTTNSTKPKTKLQSTKFEESDNSDNSSSSDAGDSDSNSDSDAPSDFMAKLTAAKGKAPATKTNGAKKSDKKKQVKQEESDSEDEKAARKKKAGSPSKKSKDSKAKKADKVGKKQESSSEEDSSTSSSGGDSSDSDSEGKVNGTKAKVNGNGATKGKKSSKDTSDDDASSSDEDSNKKSSKKKASASKKKGATPTGKGKSKAAESSSSSASDSSSGEGESSSEEESEEEEPTAKPVNAKKAKAATPSSSEEESSSSGSEEESSEASDEEDSDVEMENSSSTAIAPVANGQTVVNTVANAEFNQQGFYLRRLDDGPNATDVTKLLKTSSMKGKQIWVMALPDTVPVSMLENIKFKTDGSQQALPALMQNGDNYNVHAQQISRTIQLVIPSVEGPGFAASTGRPIQDINFQRSVDFGIPPIAPSIQQAIAAPKQARPQPDKLKQRYKPIGADVASMKAAKALTEKAIALPEPATTSQPPKENSKSKKRKHDADEEPKASTSAKKSKKAAAQETAAPADPPRQVTPIVPPQRPGLQQTIDTAQAATSDAPSSKSPVKPAAAVPASPVKTSVSVPQSATKKKNPGPKQQGAPSNGPKTPMFSSLAVAPPKQDTPAKEDAKPKASKKGKEKAAKAAPATPGSSAPRKETPIPPPKVVGQP